MSSDGYSRQQSDQEYEQAKQVIPGGVNSPARAFSSVEGAPIFFEEGSGVTLTDVDGNEYIDYVGSWGPLIFGHARERVIDRVQETAEKSTSFGAPTHIETEIAETVSEYVPSVDQVRFVNSGTEATMSAVRLARGYTGRDGIVKFTGCYHGHGDSLLVDAGSGLLTHGIPSTPGVTEGTAKDTFMLPFNDADALRTLFEERGDEIAGVILEPVAANMGVIPPEDGFLQLLRDVTEEHDALLIFDEVMTGFRLELGGAQERYDVTPDMTTLGKIIGGGMPVGAFGGKQEVMQHLAPAGDVYQAGTLSGNPISMAAGLETLRMLEEKQPYDELEQKAEWLASTAEEIGRDRNVPIHAVHAGSMVSLFLQEGPVRNYADATESDTDLFAKLHSGLLERGVYFPPSQYEAIFINEPHTEEHLQKTADAIDDVLKTH
jgi:glutamate-1-semialdehyde 2,1-aminomutase